MASAFDSANLSNWFVQRVHCRHQYKEAVMFFAMNRFRVAKGSEVAFEQVWLSRDTHLDKVPGFVEFHLLKATSARGGALFELYLLI
jgi:hypothetical protein